MARLRGSPGQATRHTGDQYMRGYKYAYPVKFNETLGPWKSIWPLGDRELPKDTLVKLTDSIIKDGAIMPLWSETQTIDITKSVIGVYEVALLSDLFRFEFFVVQSTGFLQIVIIDYTTTVTVNTTIPITYVPTTGTQTVVVAPWQDKLYFGWKGLTSLYSIRYDGTLLGPVSGSPGAVEFLLVVDNNMIAINQSGSSFQAVWAVDSNPTDWVNAGAGSAVIAAQLGRPQAFLLYNQDGIILCASGAVQLSATGTAAPSFRQVARADITGALYTYGAASSGNTLYYIGNYGNLLMYNGVESQAGPGAAKFTRTVVMLYSKHMNHLLVSSPKEGVLDPLNFDQPPETLILDTFSQSWVSSKSTGYSYMSDRPDGSAGGISAYVSLANQIGASAGYVKYNFLLGTFFLTVPSPLYAKFPRYAFGREVWIDRIDIIKTLVPGANSLNELVPTLTLDRQIRDTLQTDVYAPSDSVNLMPNMGIGIDNKGSYVSYRINGPADVIQISLGDPTAYGPFDSVVNANGNPKTDYTNPAPYDSSDQNVYYQATLDSANNYQYTSSSIDKQWIGSSMNTAGNMVMLRTGLFWTANTGFTSIEIYGREMASDAGQ